MNNAQHCVWVWKDVGGNPRFVGWGNFQETHPAKRMWALRKSYPSQLNRWLVMLACEPDRESADALILLQKAEARALALAYRKQFKDAGYDMLDSRPEGTKLGGGANREVLGPDCEVYSSIRQAATDVGVNASTITRWCQQVDSQWDFLT